MEKLLFTKHIKEGVPSNLKLESLTVYKYKYVHHYFIWCTGPIRFLTMNSPRSNSLSLKFICLHLDIRVSKLWKSSIKNQRSNLNLFLNSYDPKNETKSLFWFVFPHIFSYDYIFLRYFCLLFEEFLKFC